MKNATRRGARIPRASWATASLLFCATALAGGVPRAPDLILDHGRIPAFRIDCGKGDFLLDQNRAFHRHLEAMQIAHEYEEFVGVHNWEFWDMHVQEAIAFHVRNLKIKK